MANLSMSRDKLHSNYDSVQEQSGLFAGKGGYDVKVGKHTQLDGAVIASTAPADKNRLDTGTLGFSDIHNQADFKAEHQGGSLSSGGPVGSDLLTNLTGAALSGAGNKGHAEGTTQAAVSGGSVVIRDTANQQQDVNQLSRDTDNANGSIGPIFDKEKEQTRLKQAQLIGEIGGQAMDVIRTQGDINGLQTAKAKYPGLDAKALRETPEYKAEMQKYGTGSDLQKAAQAVTGALQGLAGNNLAGALAGGAAPYLATEIKTRVGEANPAANAMAHAVLGAITAELNHQSGVAGAVGAGGGELAARVIAGELFPGRKVAELSESEKQQVSVLSQLAAGNTAGAVAGSQAGKNAVENNFLAVPVPVPPPVAVPNASINGAGGNEAWDADDGSDPNKSREENARKPNVAKDLTDEEKAEAGGAGSGTPGGHGPEDEENARKNGSNNDNRIGKWSFEELSDGAKHTDPASKKGDLTLAGRALQKHGSREGSAFPSAKGNPSAINEQGQKIVDSILSDPNKSVTQSNTGRYGQVTDVISSSGRGLRYDSQGKLIGFLEPPK
ncbi:VENN motif pre-toxin domain-containing protein [Serratia plymuthica]